MSCLCEVLAEVSGTLRGEGLQGAAWQPGADSRDTVTGGSQRGGGRGSHGVRGESWQWIGGVTAQSSAEEAPGAQRPPNVVLRSSPGHVPPMSPYCAGVSAPFLQGNLAMCWCFLKMLILIHSFYFRSLSYKYCQVWAHRFLYIHCINSELTCVTWLPGTESFISFTSMRQMLFLYPFYRWKPRHKRLSNLSKVYNMWESSGLSDTQPLLPNVRAG